MRKILTLAFMIIPLVLSQSIFASAWRPIAEITDFEKGIIAQASRQYPDWIYKEARAFRVKQDAVVEILLNDGSRKYYASSEEKNLTENNEFLPENEKDPTGLDRKDRAVEITIEFMNIWGGKKGSELKPKELEKADSLMYKYINILKIDPPIANDTTSSGINLTPLVMGNRGTRYLRAFQELFLDIDPTIEFYTSFVTSINHTPEDEPNDQEKINALEKIKELLQKRYNQIDYNFGPVFLSEVERLDPDFHKILAKDK